MTVIIGIDPHKATHVAVAIDGEERPIARLEVVADRCQTDRLLAWAAAFGCERAGRSRLVSGRQSRAKLAPVLAGAADAARDLGSTSRVQPRRLSSEQ